MAEAVGIYDPCIERALDGLERAGGVRKSNAGRSENVSAALGAAAAAVFSELRKHAGSLAAGSVDELLVDGFAPDQVWAQIATLTNPVNAYLDRMSGIAGSSKRKRRRSRKTKSKSMQTHSSDASDEEDNDEPNLRFAKRKRTSSDEDVSENDQYEEEEQDSNEEEDEDEVEEKELAVSSAHDKDDDNDSENDMEEGRDGEEQEGDDDDDDDDEMLEDLDSDALDEEAANMTYEGFFGKKAPEQRVNHNKLVAMVDRMEPLDSQIAKLYDDYGNESDFDAQDYENENEEEENEDEDNVNNGNANESSNDPNDDLDGVDGHEDEETQVDDQGKSSFERYAEEMAKKIAQLEQEAIEEKKWTLKGEVTSKMRPKDSLLDEDIDYDFASKPVPIVTPEYTQSLDDMIRERIAARNFDNVVPHYLQKIDTTNSGKDLPEISDQKSQKSLAEIYEQKYLDSVTQNKSARVLEALKKQHLEIENMEKDLFYQLDCLTNFFYTPAPILQEEEVKPNVPAACVEEAIPMMVSDAALRAPQEVVQKQKKNKKK